MFQSISWTDFFSIVGLVILGYYTVLGLILYRYEIVNFFKHRMQNSDASNSHKLKLNESVSLMGTIRSDSSREPVSRGVSVDADELMVVSEEEGEPLEVVVSGEARLEEQQNLLEEVQTLLRVVSGDRAGDAVSLFRALLERYADLTDSTYRNHVSMIIHDGCRQRNLDFSLQEVQSWWPSL